MSGSWRSPEGTKILFERLLIGIGIGLALILLLFVATGRLSGTDSKLRPDRQSGTTENLILGGMALVTGLIGFGLRNRRHGLRAMRDDLLRNGEKISAEVVDVVEDVSTYVNDLHPWHIHARGEIEGKVYEFRSWSIWGDPTSRLGSRTVDIYFKQNNPARYFVDTRFLETGTKEGEVKSPTPSEIICSPRSPGSNKGKSAEVEILPRSDALWLSRYFTVPRFLFAISLPFLTGGGAWLANEVSFHLNGQLIEGKLEEIRTRKASGSGPHWYIISYKDRLGKTEYFRSRHEPKKLADPSTASPLTGIFPKGHLDKGKSVALRADWRNGRIRVEKWGFWIPPIVLLIPGILFSLLAWFTREGRAAKPCRSDSRNSRISVFNPPNIKL